MSSKLDAIYYSNRYTVVRTFTWLFTLLLSTLCLSNYAGTCLEKEINIVLLNDNVTYIHSLSLIHLKAKQRPKSKNQSSFVEFGAKGDGITDDTEAISRALNSSYPIIYAAKSKSFYKVSNIIVVKNINRKKMIAVGAKILNSDLTKATFLFQNCSNIKILGGQYGYSTMPVTNGGNSQHVFQLDKCRDVTVDKVHIINSPEMGIAITNSNHVLVNNSLIEHTFRDGTYSHYSANVKYINNIYKNIKDDAMSFHDYGILSEKLNLAKIGYKQASNITAQGNIVENAYQGFSSIGSSSIVVRNNIIKNTVLAGIAIFNSKELYPNGNALAINVKITGNKVYNACSDIIISGKQYKNNGQASTGRAALFIGSLGTNNQVNANESKRLKDIKVSNNLVLDSKSNGFFCNFTDGLKFTDNVFVNCSGEVLSQSISGDVIELGNITGFFGNNNTVIDNRPKVLHQHGYAINNVAGKMGNWNVKGTLSNDRLLINSQSLTDLSNPTNGSVKK